MTPKQKAEQIYDQYWSAVNLCNQDELPDFRPLIENAIIAAVEEEREACATLVDKQVRGMDVLIDHAPTELRREDLKRVKHSLEVAAACIRTREARDVEQA